MPGPGAESSRWPGKNIDSAPEEGVFLHALI